MFFFIGALHTCSYDGYKKMFDTKVIDNFMENIFYMKYFFRKCAVYESQLNTSKYKYLAPQIDICDIKCITRTTFWIVEPCDISMSKTKNRGTFDPLGGVVGWRMDFKGLFRGNSANMVLNILGQRSFFQIFCIFMAIFILISLD